VRDYSGDILVRCKFLCNGNVFFGERCDRVVYGVGCLGRMAVVMVIRVKGWGLP